MDQDFDGQKMVCVFRSPMFSELQCCAWRELELEVDFVDDVLASCAIPGKGRNTSTKLSSILVCMDNW